MSELTKLTIAEAREGLARGDFSAVELTKAHIEAIEQARGLNAYVTETPAMALDMAAASDARRKSGATLPLDGVPLGIKDLYATKGVHTQACSHILDRFSPAYESTVTANLWRDGAVMLGKLNMDEFAMGSSNEASFYGPVASPWLPPNWTVEQGLAALGGDKKGLLVPGGSSGGSAAAVAARICMAADGLGYRRLDPPAGGLYGHRRHQANLWPLFSLGPGRLCFVSRSGGSDHAQRP